MEAGKGVDVIYTDFSKAFDTVETGVLLHELRECGVKGKLGAGWPPSWTPPLDSKLLLGMEECLPSLLSSLVFLKVQYLGLYCF